MIRSLRKRHLQIWILWAVLLPVGIIVAWKAVPEKITQELLQDNKIDILPITVSTDARKGKYYSTLRMDRNGKKFQLSFKVYNGFDYGSTNIYSNSTFLIYRVAKPENELIGRIGGNKTHYFNLPDDTSGYFDFIIYDPIRKKQINSLRFSKKG